VATLMVEEADPKALREIGDDLKAKLGSGVVLLGTKRDDKGTIVLMVTKDLADRHPARDLMRELLERVGGRGGGQATMAQGGIEARRLTGALQAIREVLAGRITK